MNILLYDFYLPRMTKVEQRVEKMMLTRQKNSKDIIDVRINCPFIMIMMILIINIYI